MTDICNYQNAIIKNGCIAGDRLGNYSYFSSGGVSVVYYLITDYHLYQYIQKFVVPPIFDSKYCSITATLRSSVSDNNEQVLDSAPCKYIWNLNTKLLFDHLMCTVGAKIALKIFSKSRYTNGSKHMDKALEDLSDLLTEFAKKFKKLRKKVKKRLQRARNKP